MTSGGKRANLMHKPLLRPYLWYHVWIAFAITFALHYLGAAPGWAAISAVGFYLYSQLLAQAVEEQKTKRAGIAEKAPVPARLPPPTIDLPFPAYIPEEYVTDLLTRLGLYQKLITIEKVEQIETLAQEFSDRFGAPPLEVQNLLYAVKIKTLAAKVGIESIATEQGEIILKLFEGLRFDKEKLEPFLKDGIKFHPIYLRLRAKRLGKEWRRVLEEVLGKVG